MTWIVPESNRGRVDAAGDVLVGRSVAMDRDEAVRKINNWRSAHAYPLQAIGMTLRNRARKIDEKAVVAQRLKRLSSIERKLCRFSNMKLSQMHDLGGCRAVLGTVQQAEALVQAYMVGNAKNPDPKDRAAYVKIYNYILEPKADGYRGVHLIYKYRTRVKSLSAFDGLRIEIQVRSGLQHAWATAVEIVDTLTGQALKSSIGKDDWKRFFALMGSSIAIREKRPPVPNMPMKDELRNELQGLRRRLHAVAMLQGYSSGMQLLGEYHARRKAGFYLLVLDSKMFTIRIEQFDKTEARAGEERYAEVERETAGQPEIQAVLVSVDSYSSLKRAYPNYYLDTGLFIKEVLRAAPDAVVSVQDSGTVT